MCALVRNDTVGDGLCVAARDTHRKTERADRVVGPYGIVSYTL